MSHFLFQTGNGSSGYAPGYRCSPFLSPGVQSPHGVQTGKVKHRRPGQGKPVSLRSIGYHPHPSNPAALLDDTSQGELSPPPRKPHYTGAGWSWPCRCLGQSLHRGVQAVQGSSNTRHQQSCTSPALSSKPRSPIAPTAIFHQPQQESG